MYYPLIVCAQVVIVLPPISLYCSTNNWCHIVRLVIVSELSIYYSSTSYLSSFEIPSTKRCNGWSSVCLSFNCDSLKRNQSVSISLEQRMERCVSKLWSNLHLYFILWNVFFLLIMNVYIIKTKNYIIQRLNNNS